MLRNEPEQDSEDFFCTLTTEILEEDVYVFILR